MLVFISVSLVIKAQEDHIIRTITEDIISGDDSNRYQEIYNDLAEVYEDKIEINRCTKEQLQKLMFLNDFQIEIILEYLDNIDRVYSVFEFMYLIGFDISDCKRLSHFIEFGNDKKHKANISRGNIIFSTSVNSASKAEQGLPFALKLKGTTKIERYKTGFVAENDLGEPFFNSFNRDGFDFYSAYIYRDIDSKILKKIYIGDYHITFGNGLNMWTSYTLGKTSEILNVIPRSYGIKSYSSANENRFLRGFALSGDFSKCRLDIFFSYKDIDALLDSTDLIKTIYKDGVHISNSQIDAKDAVEEMICGANIRISDRWYSFGVISSFLWYMNANYIDVSGEISDRKVVNSVYGTAYLKSISFSGEFAIDRYNEYAYNLSSRANISDGLILAALFRDYSHNYNPIYASSFSEGSDIVNERGFYLGAEISLISELKIGMYYDMFVFTNPGYNFNTSLTGNEFLLFTKYENANSQYRFRYRCEIKDKRFQLNNRYTHKPYDKHSLSFRYRNILNKYFTNTISCGISHYSDILSGNNKGVYLYNDISYKRSRFRISLRLAMFDIDDWNARQYVYESAPLYNFSTNMYYGKGTRIYINGYLFLVENLDFWFKFAATSYSFKDILPTNYSDDKEFDDKFDIRLQLRYRF